MHKNSFYSRSASTSRSMLYRPAHPVNKLMRKYRLNKADLLFIAICLSVTAYLALVQPLFISVFSCAAFVFFGLQKIIQTVPILEKGLGRQIRFWHLAVAVMTLTALLNNFQTPAQAIFLSGLEQFMTNLATEAGAAGGGTAVDSTTIALIFNAIRGVFLLLVAAAALFAYNQAQQGNDWRPIVTQIALAFGIVIAIDVVTFLFVGTGTGTGTGTPEAFNPSLVPLNLGTIFTILQ